MPLTQDRCRRRRGLVALALLTALLIGAGALPAVAATPSEPARAPSPDEAYLDALQGQWVMAGVLGGKPVRYDAEGRRVLQGGFVRLAMRDVASPPQYEAQVFIGFDPKARDYIAHWLDRFGAAGARVVARGQRDDERLVLTFPYAEGDFRDTFTWQPASRTWTLLLESQGADGAWSTFARYTLTPRPRRPHPLPAR